MEQVWANRAGSAETAIATRHFQRLWGIPGTQLGVVGWPAVRRERLFGVWHYWWQAHLLDCLVDAQLRAPNADRLTRISRQIRGHRLRNPGWTNSYYDDMAWLALALQRAGGYLGVDTTRATDTLTKQLVGSWSPADGGGIPWRKSDKFFNAPANGPAGIFLARHGRVHRATEMADWIDATLIDPDSHLVFDGIKDGSLVRAQYTYCQGVVLGLETELAMRTGEPRHLARVRRLVGAVAKEMTDGKVLHGGGGGDGGLFNGITARYLALVATSLPGDTDADAQTRDTAAGIVLASAEAAWENRQSVDGLPLFGPVWDRVAVIPELPKTAAVKIDGGVNPSEVPEHDLSVQLGGWMLMEAAHTLSHRA
ncbi:MAG: fructose-bisphosphate aldolase [Mycobacterium sp.]|nr:fructose-bisphosphate aldolase [Mycobacterium sp.]